ncbi:MltA domain-containing protein [Caulobacter sp. S45]|uniref:MltA domain-containing protein n=1 Tax=Caulobacter sp. S45 TaxID=1641861 RepID=UPI001576463E|nr:MltA domain-containing protein [Caulobacter sp. S45]
MAVAPGRSRAALALGLLYAAALAGCAPTQLAGSPAYAPAPRVAPQTPRSAGGEGVSDLANLPGWADEDHSAALAAFQAGCVSAAAPGMQAVCTRARALGRVDDPAARVFFETNFRPMILPGPGLLTAYFAPEYPARSMPGGGFSAALRGRPADLVYPPGDATDPSSHKPLARQLGDGGQTWPYPARAGIELTPATDALAYMRPEDLFFLQIQGSGVLTFPDGRRMKASYAADNGRPFVPIASAMVRRGELERDRASGSAIRAWLRAHAGAEAQSVMDLNPRYVFFNLTPDDGREPAGAAGLPLTPGRAVAVDPAWHPYGEPYWIDAAAPTLSGAVKTYRRLVMALDTGSAIRGDVRADLYLGRGEAAGLEAGRVRHTLLMVRLVPVAGGGASAREAGAGHEAAPASGGD